MKQLVKIALLNLLVISSVTQSPIIDIEETSSFVTYPAPKPQNKLIVAQEKIPQTHNKHITEKQLDFAIFLIENLNGKVIFNHESKNTTSNKSGQFQYINIESNEEKARLQKIIQDQKEYYKQKYPKMIKSSFLQKENYIRNAPLNLRPQQTEQQMIENQNELPFCILMPSYNNARQQFYKRNVDSILQQQYTNYRIVYMDDASSDNTTQTVIDYLKGKFPSFKLEDTWQTGENQTSQFNRITVKDYEFNKIKWKFVLNEKRRKAMFNIYHGSLAFCKDNEIIILVDGDDGFAGTQTLKMLNRAYTETQSMFLYTSYAMKKNIDLNKFQSIDQNNIDSLIKQYGYVTRHYNEGGKKESHIHKNLQKITSYEIGVAGSYIDPKMVEQRRLRSIKHLMGSHILSFYVSLLRKAPMSHFMGNNGRFLDYAYDSALTLSLSELAYKRTFFFNEILYEYMADTGINDSAQNWTRATWLVITKRPNSPLGEEQAKEMVRKVLNK